MFRHIALFRFKEDADPVAVAAFGEALAKLPESIPEIRGFAPHPDLGLGDATYDFGLVADFDDEAGWRAYVDHPAHVEFIEAHSKPLLAGIARVQQQI